MPFYFRKSVSAGPFRFNFSKGGVGASVGVKGFRIGTGPRGHYVHAGRGGLYYRSSLSSNRGKPRSNNAQPQGFQPIPPPDPSYSEPDVEMFAVSSGDVLEMQDGRFSDLLDELNEKQNSIQMAWVLGGVGALVGLIAMSAFGSAGVIALIACAAVGALLGSWLDSYKRSGVLFYELEDDARQAYEALTGAFDNLMSCVGKWHVDSGGVVRDIHAWKRNAGAGHLIDRRPTVFSYALPRVLKSNVTPPAMKVGKETIYFLPDVALVVEGNKVGAVAYDALDIRFQDSNFIETNTVPGDARVIGHTWKHPNKSGGPDRRFRDNYQIPICLYETIHLTSRNGLNELLQVSRTGLAQPFSRALNALAKSTGDQDTKLSLPRL